MKGNSNMPNPESNEISISLIIPTYNRASLIEETLTSALAQKRPFSEIIVVDDGSTDDTHRVLENYSSQVRVLRTTNRGVQAARNLGVSEAHSTHVTLCDSDDLLEPNFVTTITQWLSHYPAQELIYCNFITFNDQGIFPDKFSLAPKDFFDGAKLEQDFFYEVPELLPRILTYQPLFPTGCTIQRKFYERIGGFDLAFNKIGSEDLEFTLRAIIAAKPALCRTPLTRIRKHPGNESHDSMRQKLGEAQILTYAIRHYLANSEHTNLILESIDCRRIDAFNTAFAKGDFDTALNILPLLHNVPNDFKFELKRKITALTPALRGFVWKLTQ